MKLTVPEVGACSAALTKPLAAAISCPLSTRWPRATTGSAAAPMCWLSGNTRRLGSGAGWIDVRLESCLRSGG
ncbi:hypothetical protein D9M68_680200 [compost metagenome]